MNNIRFQKIVVALDMAGCPNRCKHCYLGHSQNGNLDNEDLIYVSKEFEPYSDIMEIYSWFREPDYKNNYKELWELEKRLSKNTTPKRFELLSFWRLNRDPEYVKWAYDIGVRVCQLTFFGFEEKTDYYVGRKGAFQELLRATDILLENGIAPRWQLFVNKDNIEEMLPLIDLSSKLNLKERCKNIGAKFKLFIHQGSCEGENKKLYDKIIEASDIKKLPLEYCLDLGYTEQQLYNILINDHSTLNLVSDSPVFYVNKDCDVFPNYTETSSLWRLGNLRKDGIESVLTNYLNNNSLCQNTSYNVPISKMVQLYGNPNSTKLFGKDDYRMYILNKYCEETGERNVNRK